MAENVNDGSEVTPTFRDDDDPESQKVYSSRGRGAGLDEEGGLYEVTPDFSSRVNQLKTSLGAKPSAVVSKEIKVDDPEKPKVVVEKTTSVSSNPEDDTSAYHGLPFKKYLNNMPSSEKKQANADRVQKGVEIGVSMLPIGRAIKGIGMVGKAASEIPGYAKVVGESGAKAVKQGVEKLMANRASREDMKSAIGRMAEARKNRKAEETHLKKLYSNPGGGSPFKKGGKVKRYGNGGDVANESTSGLSPQEFKENIAERRGFVEGQNKYPAEARLQKNLALPASLARKAGVYLQEKYGDVKGNVQGMLGDAEALRELRGRQFVREPVLGYKKGGSVRGHGIESRGKTKGRFV